MEQLRAFKRAKVQGDGVAGTFNWRRHKLLAVVGGNYYYDVPIPIQAAGRPIVSFSRDGSGFFRLNLRMLTTSGEPRLEIDKDDWVAKGSPSDFQCPPSGRLIQASYANGDHILIEFLDLPSAGEAAERYPASGRNPWPVAYPITAVEITMTVAGSAFSLGPGFTTLPGQNVVVDSFFSNVSVGIGIR